MPRALACLALVVAFAAHASAEDDGPDYARNGWYLGLGLSLGFPAGWSDDWADSWEGDATQAALDSATPLINPATEQVRASVTQSGLDLEDLQLGAGGVVGYRVAPHGSLEFEVEWLEGTGSQKFTVDNTGDVGTVEIDDTLALTANVKLYALTGRIQPFGLFGLGAFRAAVETATQTSGLMVDVLDTNTPPAFLRQEPGDFTLRDEREGLLVGRYKWEGAFRVGLGTDVYITEHIAAQVKADYRLPFAKIDGVMLDALIVRVGAIYRF
jgi:opacity protein-like surface antigen